MILFLKFPSKSHEIRKEVAFLYLLISEQLPFLYNDLKQITFDPLNYDLSHSTLELQIDNSKIKKGRNQENEGYYTVRYPLQ